LKKGQQSCLLYDNKKLNESFLKRLKKLVFERLKAKEVSISSDFLNSSNSIFNPGGLRLLTEGFSIQPFFAILFNCFSSLFALFIIFLF